MLKSHLHSERSKWSRWNHPTACRLTRLHKVVLVLRSSHPEFRGPVFTYSAHHTSRCHFQLSFEFSFFHNKEAYLEEAHHTHPVGLQSGGPAVQPWLSHSLLRATTAWDQQGFPRQPVTVLGDLYSSGLLQLTAWKPLSIHSKAGKPNSKSVPRGCMVRPRAEKDRYKQNCLGHS